MNKVYTLCALPLILIQIASAGDVGNPKLECQTNYKEHKFIMDESNLAYQQNNLLGDRNISSTPRVKSLTIRSGYKKIMYLNDQKYKIVVKNYHETSPVNDYLKITSAKGHTMTYPLECRKI
jgi:hypothetical protein